MLIPDALAQHIVDAAQAIIRWHLQLGGAAIYHGVEEQRPQLGEGAPAQARDIERALNLVYFGVALWLIGLVIGELYLA